MPISIIGCGAWGMAFSTAICKKVPVNIWVRDCKKIPSMQAILSSCNVGESIKFHENIEELILASDIVVPAVPTESLRSVCQLLKQNGFSTGLVIACCKGIEKETLMLPTEVVNSELPNVTAMAISGPSFATEIMSGLPCKVVLTGNNKSVGKSLADEISIKNFSVTYSPDYITIQVCAAIKNVIAIACGITRGLKLGKNAEAIVITKGFNDVVRLCSAMNITPQMDSIIGYACFGDLVMTCNAYESRNMTYGSNIVTGHVHDNHTTENKTVEGVASAESVVKLAEKLNVNLPVCKMVYDVLYEKLNIMNAIMNLIYSDDFTYN